MVLTFWLEHRGIVQDHPLTHTHTHTYTQTCTHTCTHSLSLSLSLSVSSVNNPSSVFVFNVSPTTILQATQTSSVQGHYAQQKLRHTTIHNNRDNKVNWQFSGPVIHNRCHLRHLETSQIPGETWKTIGMQRTEAAETAVWEWEGRFAKTWFTKFYDFQNKFLIFFIQNSKFYELSTILQGFFKKIPWPFQQNSMTISKDQILFSCDWHFLLQYTLWDHMLFFWWNILSRGVNQSFPIPSCKVLKFFALELGIQNENSHMFLSQTIYISNTVIFKLNLFFVSLVSITCCRNLQTECRRKEPKDVRIDLSETRQKLVWFG